MKLIDRIKLPGHFVRSLAYNIAYGFPARDMRVIGVTGTNGKTTTSFMIHKMLVESGYKKAAIMTTVAHGIGDNVTPQIAHMTTVSVPLLMKRLKKYRAEGVDVLVLEITSHALTQYRTLGIPIEVAVMTNVTHEHLDYHGTFEHYRSAKMKLFKQAKKIGIINADDPSADYFAKVSKKALTYGIESGDLKAEQIDLSPTGVHYRVDDLNITCNIPGKFNVYNSLAAVAVGREMGLSGEQIERGIASVEGVEGRMDIIDEGQDFTVINDFAHTPDSFEKLLSDQAKIKKGKLIVMFGSAGRRDEAKRAIQGEIAGRYADEVVVTEEDDRDIDGMTILNQIAEGAEKAGKIRDKYLFLVHNRTEAIHFAINQAKTGDTVMLLGKGHEKTIERANGEEPWDEAGTAREAIRSRNQNSQ